MHTRLCHIVWLFSAASAVLSVAEEPRPTITVRGSAQISLPADSVTLTLDLNGSSLVADNAFEKVDKQTQSIVALLKQQEVAESDISLQPILVSTYIAQRSSISKVQQSIRNGNQSSKQAASEEDEEDRGQTAYQATRRLFVNVNKLSRLNLISLGLAKAGVNHITRLEFKSSKSFDEYIKLREAAVREALSKATSMASQLGAEIASIKTMTDQSQPLPISTSPSGLTDSEDPFGMGGYGSSNRSSPGSTIITHLASIDVVFYLNEPKK